MNEEFLNQRFEAIQVQLKQMAYKKYSTNIGRVELEDLEQEAFLCAWHCCQAYENKPEEDFRKLTMRSVNHALANYCERHSLIQTTGFEYSEDTENCWEAPSNLNTEESLCIIETLASTKEFFKKSQDKITSKVIEELLNPSKKTVELAGKSNSTRAMITPKVLKKSLEIPEVDIKKAIQKARVALELYNSNSFSEVEFEKRVEEGHLEVEEINWNTTSTFALVTVAKGLGLTFKESEDDTIQRMWAIKALNDRGILPSNKLFKMFRK